MAGRLEGKVALVTGGSSGIGKATALAFAKEGAKVVVAARRIKESEETVTAIREGGGEAIFVQTDVSQATEVKGMVDAAVETYGRLDCAFNNAGVGGTGPIHEFLEEEWDRTISINLKGVWLCLKYEIAQMLKQGRGAIVNNSSVAGLIGAANMSAYIASKHGVVGLTKSVALEVAKQGIRVNAVCPGYIHTPMIQARLDDPARKERIIALEPIGRVGDPEEAAEAVVWLCSDAASFVTGHAMPVDGGLVAGIPPPK